MKIAWKMADFMTLVELLYTEYCQRPDLPPVFLVILQYKLPIKLHIKFGISFGKEFNDAVV